MASRSHGKTHILLIENNPGDIELIRKVLIKDGNDITLDVLPDGEEAIHYLEKCASEPRSLTPQLILLDLNLPKKDGREILAAIKSHPKFMQIPVIVLTSSQAKSDIEASYRNHANAYLVKPMDLEKFFQIGDAIRQFWISQCQLPQSGEEI